MSEQLSQKAKNDVQQAFYVDNNPWISASSGVENNSRKQARHMSSGGRVL